jgi:hypothetical protein
MEDWMIAIIMLVIGIGSSIGGSMATKYFDIKYGINALRRELHDYREETMKKISELRRDTRGIVRCLCRIDPKFKKEWSIYRAEVWEMNNNVEGKDDDKGYE